MEKIKALLLPLALIFAAIFTFDLGARYGASNTRAVALTGQLNNYLNLYNQVGAQADARSKANLEAAIDNFVVTGALERDAWYLRFKDEPKASLEAALTKALSLRGDAVGQRFEALHDAEGGEGAQKLSDRRLAEIRTALERAQIDLLEAAPQQAPDPE
ncbi:MAG: hypothetical protein R6U56_06560 [Opitutales bacterium]